MRILEGFEARDIDAGEATIHVRVAGSGPPLLLLHGYPQTGAMWHLVAPALAEQHTVVVADLRGYGASSKPPTTDDHEPYSKRAMARDVVALMRALGHERFAVAGHDRGCLVAFRTAMDHPDVVERFVAMDGIPVVEHLERCDARFALSWWHWWFFGQTEKPAERVINADPDAWYTATADPMGEEAFADYRRAIHDPETVHAMLEDYRAGLRIDREHEEADRAAGRRIRCPMLFVWSEFDDMEELYGDPVAIWRDWADDVRGASIPSGHHMAEEKPEEVAAVLLDFLAR